MQSGRNEISLDVVFLVMVLQRRLQKFKDSWMTKLAAKIGIITHLRCVIILDLDPMV